MTLREAAVELVCFGIWFACRSCLLVVGLIADATLVCLRFCRVPVFQARLIAIFLASCAVFVFMTTPFYYQADGLSSSSFPSPFLYDEFLHAFHLKVNIISVVFTLVLHFFNCLGFLTRVMLTATRVAVTVLNTIAWAPITFCCLALLSIVWLS